MSTNKSKQPSRTPDPGSIARHAKNPGAAPVHLWNPPYCGEIDMRIARDGNWYHEGTLIRRHALVVLFSSILKKEEGEYYLVTPVEKVKIAVDDCPFVAHTVDSRDDLETRRLVFTLNTTEQITANAEHRIIVDENPVSGEPHPRIHVRNGLEALLSRSVFYQLVAVAEPRSVDGKTVVGITSENCFFELGGY